MKKSFLQLKHGRIYLGTQPTLHRYRRLQKAFNGTTEEGKAPKALNSKQVNDSLKYLIAIYGKVKKNTVDKNVRKRLIILISLIEKVCL